MNEFNRQDRDHIEDLEENGKLVQVQTNIGKQNLTE